MTRLRIPVGPGDHADGPSDAPFTLVEYGDYQCPYSARAQLELVRLRQVLGRRMRLVYRHFPLTHLHPHALVAAEAAEAAAAQGRFWEMHDLLLENQHALDAQALVSYAAALDLDGARFEADLEAHRFLQRIRRDVAGGARSGVQGTPTFFVNGARHEGAATVDAFLDALEGASPAYGF